jgi:hypothetical protein
MKNTAVVVCLHGNEIVGLDLKDRIGSEIPVFVGNEKAIEKGVRFIDDDLNRIFPGDKEGNYEEQRAVELLGELKPFKNVIDIHSSSSDLELFGIITKPNGEKIELAKKLGLDKLVIMPPKFANGKALIDFVECGISLEIGPHESEEHIDKIVGAITNTPNPDHEIGLYEVFEFIRGDDNATLHVHNFQKVKKGDLIAEGEKKYYADFDFTALFAGEEAYTGILCLAIKKVDQSNFLLKK